MTRRFVKKPIEIEAFRYGFDELPEWAITGGAEEATTKYEGIEVECLVIETLEGTMRAHIGDFVIKGIKGEIYPCKADIFNDSYTEVMCDYAKKMSSIE